VPDAFFASEADYAAELIDLIQYPQLNAVREQHAKDAADRFSWPRVAERFSAEWTTHRAPRT
jgi:hypothetical protein